ncbi:MAG TPA: hypothetical protein VKB57_14795 [Acidimicrobiales bacterium]|nr:hypothetical protein [Acidimicrobiales bacterium]
MRHHVDEAVTHRRPRGHREADADEFGRLAGAGHVARGRPAGAAAGERGLLALQRAAGNRAVVQLMRAAPPVVQRCGCGGCATCGPAREDDRPGQGVEGAEEEFPAPAQGVVQRAANFAAGPVHQVNNLAAAVVNGTPAGVTWPTLNGTQFWSNAAARAALNKPTLKVTAAGGAGGGFDAQVDAVADNTGSFDETVLSAGPWRLNTTRGTIGALLPALAAACSGGNATRFRAYGKPSDVAMQRANRRHEDHHADDHKAAFNTTVLPWDQKLTQAKASGTKFHGATAAAAEAALWAAMGGTPDQIADAFMAACAAAVVAYHGSAAGGPIGAPTGPGSRSHCAISWAKYTNPS